MKTSSSSKPISSPGRTEKFPPPLMRFLRSNVGRRNSGRSRASPLFGRKKKASITSSAIETQEPSSPKVTCIGQVRVRRSKNCGSKTPQKRGKCTGNKCCDCFPKSCFINLELFRPNFRKCVCLFNRRDSRVRTDSLKSGSIRFLQEQVDDDKEEQIEEREQSTTPPKNALLLTRCRSAPYRSSSLACRFLGSPLRTEEERETETKDVAQKTEQEEKRASETELTVRRDSASKSRGDRDIQGNNNLRICAEVEDEYSNEVNKEEDEYANGAFSRPLMLVRCKSEPARSGSEKFDPQSSEFWRHRRLGNTE